MLVHRLFEVGPAFVNGPPFVGDVPPLVAPTSMTKVPPAEFLVPDEPLEAALEVVHSRLPVDVIIDGFLGGPFVRRRHSPAVRRSVDAGRVHIVRRAFHPSEGNALSLSHGKFARGVDVILGFILLSSPRVRAPPSRIDGVDHGQDFAQRASPHPCKLTDER